MNILKFDESDSILGSNDGRLSCIFALITDDNVEFNIHAEHGLHELVRDWLATGFYCFYFCELMLIEYN